MRGREEIGFVRALRRLNNRTGRSYAQVMRGKVADASALRSGFHHMPNRLWRDPVAIATPACSWMLITVLESHRASPVASEWPRKWPSTETEKTTPGMAVTAADCAGGQSVLDAAQGTALRAVRSWPFLGTRSVGQRLFSDTEGGDALFETSIETSLDAAA